MLNQISRFSITSGSVGVSISRLIFSGSIGVHNTITKSPVVLKPRLPHKSRSPEGRHPADTLSGKEDPGPKHVADVTLSHFPNHPEQVVRRLLASMTDAVGMTRIREDLLPPHSGFDDRDGTPVPMSKHQSPGSLSRGGHDRCRGTGYARWM